MHIFLSLNHFHLLGVRLCVWPAAWSEAGHDHPAGVWFGLCVHVRANGAFPHLRLLSSLWRAAASLRPAYQRHTLTGEPKLAAGLLQSRNRTVSEPGGVPSSRSSLQLGLVIICKVKALNKNASANHYELLLLWTADSLLLCPFWLLPKSCV